MKRNANLDVLRGIAILLVLGRHSSYFPIWTQIGWAGVDLFFVLSGFLISGLLFAEWQSRGAIDLKRFYIRRGFKIYPAFYTLFAVTILWPSIAPHQVTWPRTLAEVLFLQSYAEGVWGHTWSLAVEEHFYLALPLLLCAMIAISRNAPDPFRRLPFVFVVVALTDLILRTDYRVVCRSHARMDGLLFGVLLAYYRYFHPQIFGRIARSRAGFVAMASAVFILLRFPLGSAITHWLGITVIYLGFGALLAKVIDLKPFRILRPVAFIGAYSYSIYLWHLAVLGVVSSDGLLLFGSYLVVSIAVGVAMAKLIEVPALRLRERWFSPTRRRVEGLVLHGSRE